MRTVVWVASVIFVLDQITKYWVVQVLDLKRVLSIEVFPPYLNLEMAWNTGINFGAFAGASPWIWIVVALVIVGAVLWWVWTDPHGRWQQISAGLLVGGALGNVIDRLIYGAVADFLNMSCCGFTNPTSFNVADIAVFIGAFGMVIFSSDSKKAA
ncbi:lipoprotein signal peptidase [Roseovarius atlanticus]|uniref:Lipoprotein signal peptidase n=1 Tax=Roseovarius atlanticus TaxID=1641875 RepID=A0A0T5NXV1_9RHOB|nr:signal peptidase II [Roseovarius atlanticus]KRS13600.1 lipoprotein signal peptidase [Roseovarius atlanticus]